MTDDRPLVDSLAESDILQPMTRLRLQESLAKSQAESYRLVVSLHKLVSQLDQERCRTAKLKTKVRKLRKNYNTEKMNPSSNHPQKDAIKVYCDRCAVLISPASIEVVNDDRPLHPNDSRSTGSSESVSEGSAISIALPSHLQPIKPQSDEPKLDPSIQPSVPPTIETDLNSSVPTLGVNSTKNPVVMPSVNGQNSTASKDAPPSPENDTTKENEKNPVMLDPTTKYTGTIPKIIPVKNPKPENLLDVTSESENSKDDEILRGNGCPKRCHAPSAPTHVEENKSIKRKEPPLRDPSPQLPKPVYSYYRSKPKIGCWNCADPNHRYPSCPKPFLFRFCFHCGLPGYTSLNCPDCDGKEKIEGKDYFRKSRKQ
ncbi:uncharacterized protein LOC122508726 [Leptopilina heterotoma]|uniref:uncharacterized protein LOC122508726 n=1 Tax=Leptopilina heterotoma TaxID=63436 RepID=UPI001CA83FC6|nr:uncharacterized protein LOC122508726 [Leptopilina heterotoma]XP_043478180.1 uncharacterized protein LOC122508726 [Leptopilina heterotoma]